MTEFGRKNLSRLRWEWGISFQAESPIAGSGDKGGFLQGLHRYLADSVTRIGCDRLARDCGGSGAAGTYNGNRKVLR